MIGKHKVLGGVLLVSGTTIGAAMLALPVATGIAGFIPSLTLFVACWLCMTFTAHLLLEVNLWVGEKTNLITMAGRTLGFWGQVFSWIAYLFLLYSLTTAYIAGSGPILSDVLLSLTGVVVPPWAGSIPLLLLFGILVFEGTVSVDYANRFLMLGLLIAYCLMALFLTPHIDLQLLEQTQWKTLLVSASVVITSFGFHIIIPTLTTYLHHDVVKLRKAILIGSVIPLIVYTVWQGITLGIIPVHGLETGYLDGANGAKLLADQLASPTVSFIARFFSLFAIITSFLGVSLSLSDFLADGFHIKKNRSGRALLYVLTFLPPVLFTLTNPRAFLSALEYAGAFGVVTLLILLPTVMVWVGRYRKGFRSTYKAPGGKIALVCAFLFGMGIIVVEVAHQIGWIENSS